MRPRAEIETEVKRRAPFENDAEVESDGLARATLEVLLDGPGRRARGSRGPHVAHRIGDHLELVPDAEAQDDDVTVYHGVRAQESPKRAQEGPRSFVDDAGGYWIERPLFTWSARQVFDYLRAAGIAPNPLYLLGASRVGCFPCVPHINHGDLKRQTETMPEVWDRIVELEALSGRSFFKPGFIPRRFNTGHDPKSGKSFPTADDVRRYLIRTPAERLPTMDAPQTCMSVYNLCE